MADDIVGGLTEANNQASKLLTTVTGIANQLQIAVQHTNQIAGGGGAAPQIANYNSPNPITFTPAPPPPPNFGTNQQGQANWNWAVKATGRTIASLMALLPSGQETVQMGSIAERMRFYSSNLGNNGGNNPLSATNNKPLYQYSIMNNAMRMGTAVTPDDVAQAINLGSDYGFSTGLKNFNAGTGFAGILGGAALASNLAPGIGITGGMGVMANINQAQNVNMLRMLGIQVRGQNGATMNDLPQIIEQLYGILTRNNPSPTPEDIATSLMPGNALDSLIKQYFGNDQNTRRVIISGLIQRIKSGNLRTSGTRSALGLTGGTTTAIASLGMRNTAEGQMIQGLTDATNKAMVGTNNFIQRLYTGIGGLGLADNPAGDVLRGAQQISTALTTFGGIRGGAGANILSGLTDATVASFYKEHIKPNGKTKLVPRFNPNQMLKIAGIAGVAGIGTSYLIGNGGWEQALNQDQANVVNNLSQLPSAPGSQQSTIGNQFTGAITINVSVPPGADPYAYKAAMMDAFTALT